MSGIYESAQNAARITCMTHQLLGGRIAACFAELGASTVLSENARCMRQRVRKRALGLPGSVVEYDDAPMEIFRTTVRREAVPAVMQALTAAGDLSTPGRGTLFAQDVIEYRDTELPQMEVTAPAATPGLLRDLRLLTCILSTASGGDLLGRVALQLGACVPVISLGTGTGIRDRLGLLRVTIPPEKQIVSLMVPAHDASGIQRLLIEEGRLNRPGGGFLYQTPVRQGVADALLRIGRQTHAASIEQIIAAVDELKDGTSWRKRFAGIDEQRTRAGHGRSVSFTEISFVCAEGRADGLIRAAMGAGAGGVTTSRLRCLGGTAGDDAAAGAAARLRGVLCVPSALRERVLKALCEAIEQEDATATCRLQALEAPSVFAYQHTA